MESFSDSLVSGIEKFYASEGYVTIFDFLSKDYCFTVPKNFAGESFSVSLLSGIEKFYASEGYVTMFCRKFFVSQCRKSSQVNRFVLFFRKFRVAKKLMDKRAGNIKIFRRKFFLSQWRKNS